MEINSSLKAFAAAQASSTAVNGSQQKAPEQTTLASQSADTVTISAEALSLAALPEGAVVTPMADVPGWPPKDPVRN